MENEILKQILDSQNLMFNELKGINTRLDNLETEVKDLKQDVKEIQRIQTMYTGTIEIILGEVVKINDKIDSINTETKQNTYFISNIKKAIQ